MYFTSGWQPFVFDLINDINQKSIIDINTKAYKRLRLFPELTTGCLISRFFHGRSNSNDSQRQGYPLNGPICFFIHNHLTTPLYFHACVHGGRQFMLEQDHHLYINGNMFSYISIVADVV